jgi:hypothetical protein
MKGNVFAIFGSLVLAGSFVAAQDPPDRPPAPRDPAPQASSQAQEAAKESSEEMTLTGCLLQGSGPTVFILENAKLSTDPKNAKGRSYVLEISAPQDKISTVLNRSVRIVGIVAEPKVASHAPAGSGQKRNESDLPRLTAKRITPSSETCSAGD